MSRVRTPAFIGVLAFLCAGCGTAPAPSEGRPPLPRPGEVLVDRARGEVAVLGVVQHPQDKPCIDDFGQRVQAFAGSRLAAGGPSKFADYFVFLTDAKIEDIHDALLSLGVKPLVHYPIPEAQKRSGLRPDTKPEDFLQGDPVQLTISWSDGGRDLERPYQDFVVEKVLVEGGEVVKPWTPHFVYHGSGAIHASGTGCIACPCDCAGGIIADNRYPVYNPKPIVKFDWSRAPAVGTTVVIRIRPSVRRGDEGT